MKWPLRRDHVIDVISYFDTFRGPNPYAFLSNFHEGAKVQIDGFVYPTTEHYFQAQKSVNPAERQEIRLASSPGLAKALGRACKLRPDWELVKVNVMLRAVREKFAQHPTLAAQLLD